MDLTTLERLPLWIGGRAVAAHTTRYAEVTNPATGEVLRHVPLSDAADVDAAAAAATAALPAWRAAPALRRARILMRFRELMEAHKTDLARLVSQEHGKTISDAEGSITRGIEVVEFATGIPHLLKGDFSDNVGTGVDSFSLRQPVGVCAGITPFNFPAMVPMWMFPVALACGNAFILKPSERDPTMSLRMAELLAEAGLPDGVFNVVHGDKEAVDAILDDPDIQAVSFVGSSAIAQYVYSRGTANGKRVQAMGGAKNHAIIMPDADLDQVTNELIGAGYGSAGERCMAISVAVPVTAKIADALVERLKPRVESLRVGLATDPDVDYGPMVTREHRAKVMGYIDQGIAEGAELVVDGRGFKMQGYEDGFYLGGSLFDRVTPEMTTYKDEIFGPVLQVARAEDFDSAMALPSRHQYGNGVAIFTRDGDAAREFAAKVQVGMVGINIPIPVPLAYHTFGGWKRSAFGDVNQHGPEGVRFYTRVKTVTQRWPKAACARMRASSSQR